MVSTSKFKNPDVTNPSVLVVKVSNVRDFFRTKLSWANKYVLLLCSFFVTYC